MVLKKDFEYIIIKFRLWTTRVPTITLLWWKFDLHGENARWKLEPKNDIEKSVTFGPRRCRPARRCRSARRCLSARRWRLGLDMPFRPYTCSFGYCTSRSLAVVLGAYPGNVTGWRAHSQRPFFLTNIRSRARASRQYVVNCNAGSWLVSFIALQSYFSSQVEKRPKSVFRE